MRMKNPIVLVTRPEFDAQKFVEHLRQISGPFEAVISPAFEYEPIAADLPAFDVAIFTSKAGVSFAPLGNGRRAYCVGLATAQAARDAGYDAISADGSAEELIALILEKKPKGVLLHLRGEVSRGDINARLNAAGLSCKEVVLYRKAALTPNRHVLDITLGNDAIIVPVFSAETVSILAKWPVSWSGCTVIAISDIVAQAAVALSPGSVKIADEPNMHAVALATARMIA